MRKYGYRFQEGKEIIQSEGRVLEHSFATRHERGITIPQRGTLDRREGEWQMCAVLLVWSLQIG